MDVKAAFEGIYRALGGGKAEPEMMVDRAARDKMAALIEEFSNGKISAFAFDDAISQIQSETGDITVHNSAGALWFLYDDCDDHKFDGGKETWDYMERLRLILLSDGHYLTGRALVGAYARARAVAIWALLLFTALHWPPLDLDFVGSFWWWAFPWIAFCGFSGWRMLAKTLEEKKAGLAVQKLCPFNSMGQIRALRSEQPEFVKRKYPGKQVEKVPFYKFSRQSSFEGSRLEPLYKFLHSLIYWFLLMAMAPFILPLVMTLRCPGTGSVVLPGKSIT